jgi:glycosyltransferase involved in cell wall biosynthesis
LNILHISNTDLPGGRFTGFFMNRTLDPGDHAAMAVWNKRSDQPHVHSLRPPKPGIYWLWANIAKRVDTGLGLEGLTGLAGTLLAQQSYFQGADVIHLQLIQNDAFFSMLSLPRLARMKPVVWTIHDSWPLSGMCIYSFACDKWLAGCRGRCPHPRGHSPIRRRIPALHWHIKNSAYARADLHLVVASNWTLERVKKSPLLNRFPCRLIPFGVDLQAFTPRSKQESRKRLGIAPGQKIIAFRGVRSGSDQYHYKGMRWLKEALERIEPGKLDSLLVFQDGSEFSFLERKFKVHDLGWADGELLVDALCAADLFLMPSVQESFGLMAVEAMACGTPVIACEGTALPEVIRAPRGGLAVPAMNSEALASAMSRLLDDGDLRTKMGQQGRKIAEEEYSFSLYVKRHVQLYNEVIERHKGRMLD